MDGVRPDFTIAQDWQAYTEEEHAIWRLLFERQQKLLAQRACREYLDGLSRLGVAAGGIPDFRRLSDILERATGWRIVAVPGLVPDEVFFAHLYWYTVEFGLIATPDGLRIYGSGILSSAGESVYCLDDPRPQRLRFDLKRVMRTRYRIDDFQQTYFVIASFEELFAATRPDFTPIYRELADQPDLDPAARLPEDRAFPPPPLRGGRKKIGPQLIAAQV